MEIESLGDIHWERSNLVHMGEPRKALKMVGNMGVDMEKLRVIDWENH